MTDLTKRRLAVGAAVAALVFGLIGATFGTVGLLTAGEASDKADTLLESRDTARKIACDEFNAQQARSIHANEAQVREVFRSLTSDDELTPDDQARLDQLFADHDAVIEAAFPMRDCTPEGIATYYQEQQP